MADNLIKRFSAKTEKTATCWNWVACKDGDGYGRFKYNGQTIGAHRAAYLMFVGDIEPTTLTVDHKCRNYTCARGDFLFAA